MKRIFLCIAAAWCIPAAYAQTPMLIPDASAGDTFFTLKSPDTPDKKIRIIGGANVRPLKIIYIFHGYKPSGDPYHQDPSFFIRNWKLDALSSQHNLMFILPDCGDSVYPLSSTGSADTDLSALAQLHRIVQTKYRPQLKTDVMGFSAGVEGAIKFSSLLPDRGNIIAISGNYTLYDLPRGEYLFHKKVFGGSSDVWNRENPETVLRAMTPLTLYLFCEEHNAVNNRQAQHLINAKIPGLTIKDCRTFGKGHSHDWKFLTDPSLVSALTLILTRNE